MQNHAKKYDTNYGILSQSNYYISLPLFHPSVPFLAAHPVVIFGSLPENNEKIKNYLDTVIILVECYSIKMFTIYGLSVYITILCLNKTNFS